MFAVCSPNPLSCGLVGKMSFHHNPHNLHNNNHYAASLPPSLWDSSDQQFDYPPSSQNYHSLVYRPRFDAYSFPAPTNYMASPPNGVKPLPNPSPTAPEYPEDPSFETGSDGRIEMAQDEIDAIIRNKRKVRDPKACYACHRRKVKCNRELPCDSCVKRDHPELCSYERPTKRRRLALTSQLPRQEEESKSPNQQSGPNVTVPKQQWERINHELQQLREQLRNTPEENVNDAADAEQHDPDEDTLGRGEDDDEREGIYAPSNQMGTMYLGSRSVLAYMMGLGRSKSSRDATRSLLEENILPKLGLDNESVTYPFVDLWSTDNSIQDISGLCKALPNDDLCRHFFDAYRDVACTIYPVVPETAEFERELDSMLRNRAELDRNNLQPDQTNPLGKSLSFLSLVFAVLASGAQCTNRPAKERELTSQVYTCCSYQALRMANFMTHPNLETIQASLIIGNVLAYNMNPGVAYIYLGMVIRMAFTIGIQMNTAGLSEKETWLRRRVWWALSWQDSHYSISYDRPSATALCNPEIPYSHDSASGQRSYAESMYNIISLTQEIILERSLGHRSQTNWLTIQKYKDRVHSIVNDGAPYLRDRTKCEKITQHLERLALKLHSSYVISELCRPALKEASNEALTPNSNAVQQSPPANRRKGSGSRSSSSAPGSGAVSMHSPINSSDTIYIISQARRECIRALESTVEAYVELYSLSEFAARSWIGIQRAISAGFLLGTLSETNQEPHILQLLKELERCISQRTMDDPTFEKLREGDEGGWQAQREQGMDLTEAPHWARSMTASLKALGKLNETLAGHKAGAQQSTYATVGNASNRFGIGMSALRGQQSLPPMNMVKTEQNYGQQQQVPSAPGNPNPMMGSGINVNTNIGWGTPMTPDDSSGAGGGGSGVEWNYGNLRERGAAWIQPALWK